MNLLDRFRKRRRVSEVSEDPTTFFMMESIQDSVETALNPVNPFSPHYQLGPLQHLLVLSYPEDQLKAYLLKYKEAADVIMYCQYRFNGQTIPAELHYLHKKIADVVHTHEQQITGKKNNGVRNFIRSYLKIHKVDLNLKMLFEQKNNDLLLEKLSSAVQIINHKEENYISVRKADFLLQEL